MVSFIFNVLHPTSSITNIPTASIINIPTASIDNIPTSSITNIPTASIINIPTASINNIPTATYVDIEEIHINMDNLSCYLHYWGRYEILTISIIIIGYQIYGIIPLLLISPFFFILSIQFKNIYTMFIAIFFYSLRFTLETYFIILNKPKPKIVLCVCIILYILNIVGITLGIYYIKKLLNYKKSSIVI